MSVEKKFEKALETHFERGKIYGEGYKVTGKIIKDLFPKGVVLKSADDFGRFWLVCTEISKLQRYCNNFSAGGHKDSIHDLGVYAFLLEELDDCAHRRKE